MSEYGDLLTAIDALWGWMPAQQVKEITQDWPELADLCVRIHHNLWHATTGERVAIEFRSKPQ